MCPREANAECTLIYIRNHLAYKTKHALNIYISFELESTLAKIFNPKKIIIIGCIYQQPNMSVTELNDDHLNELLDKLSKKNKTIFLLSDFHINLLKYHTHPPTNELLDSLSTSFLLPKILQPTRLKCISKTLTDKFSLIWLLQI